MMALLAEIRSFFEKRHQPARTVDLTGSPTEELARVVQGDESEDGLAAQAEHASDTLAATSRVAFEDAVEAGAAATAPEVSSGAPAGTATLDGDGDDEPDLTGWWSDVEHVRARHEALEASIAQLRESTAVQFDEASRLVQGVTSTLGAIQEGAGALAARQDDLADRLAARRDEDDARDAEIRATIRRLERRATIATVGCGAASGLATLLGLIALL